MVSSSDPRPPWLAAVPGNAHSEIAHVAIAIRNTRHGTHTGIIHRDGDKSIDLLHLGWHHTLMNEPAGSAYAWVQPGIHPSRARSIAGLCRLIWRRFQQTNEAPYAFRYIGEAFDAATGAVLLGTTSHGLTCSTFVLAVFTTFGIELLALEEWALNPRADDQVVQERLLAMLRATGAEASHCDDVGNEIGCVRFRPEEVAGGSSAARLPASFEYSERAGRDVIANLPQSAT